MDQRMEKPELRAALERRLGEAVRLKLTRNRRRMVTFRREEEAVRLRLQRAFLAASPDLLDAVAAFVRNPAGKGRVRLQEGLAELREAIEREARERRRVSIRTVGRWHDLEALFDGLNRKFFDGELTTRVTWGRRTSGRRRSIRFGTYDTERNLIRLHPALDEEWVPAFFVRFVLYHEMLHAVIPIRKGADGRNILHGPEFKRREQAYPDYERAREWERKNLDRFLTGH